MPDPIETPAPAPPRPAGEPAAKERTWAAVVAWVLVALVVLFVLYVLSVGPVVWLLTYADIDSDGHVWTFYAPAAWLYNNVPLLGAYLRWWTEP